VNETPEDRQLTGALHELRHEVEAAVPPFFVTGARRAQGRRHGWWVAAAATAAAAVVLWSVVSQDDASDAYALDLSATTWIAPSDFLLETPGRGLLRSLPAIDVTAYVPQQIEPDRGTADTSD
jgi:hypothetical protein